MTLIVTGATSQIGHFLLQRLQAAGRPVWALSRRAQPECRGVTWAQADLGADLPLPTGTSVEAIVSFGPLDALAAWLQRQPTAPAPRLVATSSMSVLSKQDSNDPYEQALVGKLRAGEDGVIAQCERLGMQWTLLRPTLIYGAGLDKSLTPIARRAMRLRVFPIPMARGLRQPVHADDVAQAVLAALAGGPEAQRVFEIGGGERLEYRTLFERVRHSLDVATIPVRLPHGALRAMHALLPSLRGPLSRLEVDLVADNGPLRRLLGVEPRGFDPDAGMWQPTAAGANG